MKSEYWCQVLVYKNLTLDSAGAPEHTTYMIDKYQIAANVALAGLDGFNGRLTAKQQRAIFGANVFGKKVVKIDASNQGRVIGSFSVCFGTDRSHFEKSFEEIAKAVNGGHAVNF